MLCMYTYLDGKITFNDIITVNMLPNRLKLGLKTKQANQRRLIPHSASSKNRSEGQNAEISLLFSKKPSFDETVRTSSAALTSTVQLLSTQTISSPLSNSTNTHSRTQCLQNGPIEDEYKNQIQNQANIWKSKAQKMSKQNEDLQYKYKIIEAELQNTDKQYYERQINRLRNQYQSIQIERVGIIHKLEQSTEQKIAYQATIKKKNDQLRATSQQLEKEKSFSNDLKYQFGEREKALRFALEESEKANEMLHRKLGEVQAKCTRIEVESKDQVSVISSLQMQLQAANTRLKDAESIAYISRKRYQQHLSQKESKIQTMSNENNQKLFELETALSKQKLEISALNSHIQDNKLSQTCSSLKDQQEIIAKDKIIRNLEKDIADKEREILSSRNMLEGVHQKLRQTVSISDFQKLQQQYEQLDKKKSSCSLHLQQLKAYQQQIQILKVQLISSKSNLNSPSFEENLKKTLQANSTLKQELLSRIDLIDKLKQQIQQSSSKEKQLNSQVQILIRKNSALQKNSKIELQVQEQKMVNEVESIRRKLVTMQARLQAKIKQNKQKDEFIKSQIIGKSGNQPHKLLSELQKIFNQRDRIQEEKISEIK